MMILLIAVIRMTGDSLPRLNDLGQGNSMTFLKFNTLMIKTSGFMIAYLFLMSYIFTEITFVV